MCGATSYRSVIDRDATGQMRQTSLYQCSGCSVVFTDPTAWRLGESGVLPADDPIKPLVRCTVGPADRNHAVPVAPDLRTYGLVPHMDNKPA